MPHPHLDWRAGRKDARSVSSARVSLALLRIYRKLPLAQDETDFTGVARSVWPVVRLFPASLAGGLQSAGTRVRLSRIRALCGDDEVKGELANLAHAAVLPVQPLTDAVFELLGDAIASHTPAFAPLLDQVESKLAEFASCSLPSDHRERVVADLLTLTEVERAYLRLCTAVGSSPLGASLFGIFNAQLIVDATQAAIGAKEEHDVRAMLNRNSRLFRSGLLENDPFGPRSDMSDALRLSQDATRLLRSPARTVQGLAKVILCEAPASTPGSLTWPHLREQTSLLRDLLVNAAKQQARGINILLHGAPGTGKTQYALRLIEESGLHGYSVSDLDRFGTAASRSERLSSLLLTQMFAPHDRSVVLLDEAEDVFRNDYNDPLARAFGRREEEGKAWMNRLLEENARPVIWISNRVDHIDPAYLRRFSYCLEFPTTPRPVRRQIAEVHLGPVGCSPALVDQVAAQPRVSPALVASAARGASIARGPDADETVRLVLGGLLRAAGEKFQAQIPERATRFDLRYLNVSGQVSAETFVNSICRLGRARAVLSGPPGTGKTQLAGEIAMRLGRELVYRTASDINSMWYGQSERNVARMFDECDVASEVLFLDEADSLLGSREASGHRADVAVTAEFLRRIENFKGVFVCATNFRAHLDAALLRRFEFRVELLPLTVWQRRSMFLELALGQSEIGTEGGTPLDAILEQRLARLDQLTPGDFANVVKRLRLLQLQPDAAGWLAELEAEHSAKPGAARSSVGFL